MEALEVFYVDSKGEALTQRQFEEETEGGRLVGVLAHLTRGRDAEMRRGNSTNLNHNVSANWFEISEEDSDTEVALEVLEDMKISPRS